ncbi:MAG: pyruvate kinase, partial [Pseudomonadota bacterium]
METNDRPTLEVFRELRAELAELREEISKTELAAAGDLASVDPAYRESALNLLQYLVTRQLDLRPLQLKLWRLGLSSLGRIEGHVRGALDQVIQRVDDVLARDPAQRELNGPPNAPSLGSDGGDRLLRAHTRALLGPKPPGRHVYVMVTAPDASEVSEEWVSHLLDAGMNVLRVNGAHEDVAQWRQVANTARKVAHAHGAPLRILVDLPGPKLRTIAPHPGPCVVKWRPERDVYGRVTRPCHIRLRLAGGPRSSDNEPSLDLPQPAWSKLCVGDQLEFRDARGRKRTLLVVEGRENEALATLERTAYLVPETTIDLCRGSHALETFQVGPIPARPFRLTLAEGDRFRLRSELSGVSEGSGVLPVMGCTASLDTLTPGARVLFDDGKLECIVETTEIGGVVVSVRHAPGGKFRLGTEKGINLPDSPATGPTLSPGDERALAFAVAHADIVGASFVRNAQDVRALYERLGQLNASKLGVILKIETAAAFAQLPTILLTAMSRYPLGVMIARGDLAVEAGFERLAELQEEILWLCEAAHLPAIWATQVLDQLARTGAATRAEVTDAA